VKAAVLPSYKAKFVVEDVDLAEPQADEVLVKVAAVAVCHTDVAAKEGDLPFPPPIVLGHEGAGVVEKVGSAVTTLKPGDHVILTTAASCGKCPACWMGRPTLCQTFWAKLFNGTMWDDTRRLRRKDGTELGHMFFQSSFAQYAIVNERTAIKIRDDAPLDKVCLFGCGSTTGIGAVLNVAKVPAGATVAIFGCGGLGLSAVMAAKFANAGRIICVDVLDWKLNLAQELGATDIINASKENPVERIMALTGFGVDFSFEFAGRVETIVQSFEATHPGGMTVVSGAPPMGQRVSIDWLPLLAQKMLTGAAQGAAVPGVDIPRWVDLYMAGRLPIDRLITRTYSLDQINEAFEAFEKGEVIRAVITP